MTMNPSLLGALSQERALDLRRAKRQVAQVGRRSLPRRAPGAAAISTGDRRTALEARRHMPLRARAGWLLVGLGLRLALASRAEAR
jgi:hypothetical protein